MQFLKKLTAFFMLCLTAVCAVFSIYQVMPKAKALQKNTTNDIFINTEPITDQTVGISSQNVIKKEDTVLASTKGKVLGKIEETLLSPYNAPIKFDKVYLKNSTGINLDFKAELAKKINIDIKKSIEPEVLIFSTHTTESYMLEERDYYTEKDATGTTDSNKNVVKIGAILKQKLEQNGISVIQNSTIHDHPKFSGCYDRSAETVKSYLKKYPSIKIVIDVHRDSVNYDDATKVKPTVTVNGKKAAQVMLVAGCEAGAVEGFPNWKENLRLSMKLHQTIEEMYPSLARPITFTARKYNLHLTTGSLLIEMGTEANTLNEAEYSAELLANALNKLLNSL